MKTWCILARSIDLQQSFDHRWKMHGYGEDTYGMRMPWRDSKTFQTTKKESDVELVLREIQGSFWRIMNLIPLSLLLNAFLNFDLKKNFKISVFFKSSLSDSVSFCL